MIYLQSQVDRLLAAKDRHIQILEQSLADLRSQVEKERRRAEEAIDRMLEQSNIHGVTLPLPKKTAFPEKANNSTLRKAVMRISQVGESIPGDKEEENASGL